jgi:endoglycosylceramidase
MDRAVTAGTAHGDALLATEFGATRDLATLRRLTDGFDTRFLSWLFWSYDGNVVADLHADPSGANVHEDALDALVRPDPTAVNGTPTGTSFDPVSGDYRLVYSTSRPDGTPADPKYRTSILLPHRVYPEGYTVTVDGATVGTCSTTLVLRNHPDASSVHVHVTRGGPCARPRLP